MEGPLPSQLKQTRMAGAAASKTPTLSDSAIANDPPTSIVVEKACSSSTLISSSPDLFAFCAEAGVSVEMVEVAGQRALHFTDDDGLISLHGASLHVHSGAR